ncbi:MAG: LLM class F420-dependent oxidoreductase [Steroidobacteraceae bacterium]
MKASFFLPTDGLQGDEDRCSLSALAQIGRLAEQIGFDGCAISEHPAPGVSSMAYGGHCQLDPFVALTAVAAATTRLRLQTHLLVLPYRNPLLTANAAASLDALSGGRLTLGVGAGYSEAEFRALGVDFHERNELTDEAITVLKTAWAGEPLRFKGRHFEATENLMWPLPHQRPHPPLWVGGNSNRAIRRAVELGDGWIPFPNPPELAAQRHSRALYSIAELRERISYVRRYTREVRRTQPLEIVFLPLTAQPWMPEAPSAQSIVDGAGACVEAGVTYFTLAIVGPAKDPTLGAFLSNMEWFGAHVLPHIEGMRPRVAATA